jgi:CelD/BcsL family acetyltransferase involved in cellulose biosynthesis
VTVRLDHGATGFFFNAGMDPDAGQLSPGVNLELASIRDAIERGLQRFDLGPGLYRYKSDLGGVTQARYQLVVVSPALRGWLTYGAINGLAHAREWLGPTRRTARVLRLRAHPGRSAEAPASAARS